MDKLKRIKYLEKYKRFMKKSGWEVVHLTNVSPKKLKETIEFFKKHFIFEDVIFVMRCKTTRRRIKR